jgi:hypothetical protein
MGTVLSGSRGFRGGRLPTSDFPGVRLVRGACDIARPGKPLLLVEDDRASVIFGPYSFAVAVATSPLHFGGARRWLVCPGCGIKRVSLYIVATSLLCRRCAGLRYASQGMNGRSRAIERADRIRAQLGWPPGVLRPHGQRPALMWWSTFRRLLIELEEVEAALLPDLSAWADRATIQLRPRTTLATRDYIRS